MSGGAEWVTARAGRVKAAARRSIVQLSDGGHVSIIIVLTCEFIDVDIVSVGRCTLILFEQEFDPDAGPRRVKIREKRP